MIETPWFTTEEAAEYVRASRRVLDKWVQDGRLIKHYPGGVRSPRFHRDHLDALMVPQEPGAPTDE